MKRVLTFLAVAALLAVSCNKEQGAISGDAARVTYTVAGPGQVATKTMTMGTIGTDYKLFYEVRLWDGTNLGDALTGDGLSGNKTVAADAWPVTVQFDLARGKQYKILFWAQSTSAPEGLFSASNLTAIGINYTKMAANNENCDAFSGADVITPSGATAASVTLRRPFALVNLGTSDAVQFGTASGGVGVGNVSAKLSGDIATAFNVATGVAGTALSGSFTVADAPIDASSAATLSVGTDAYNYLSAVYVLPLGESGTIGVEYAIKDNQTPTPADITSLKVTNVPVKANHRSNIVGKLLTGTTTYSITVDQAFTGDTNKNATPSFASITELNAFFASLITTGPNDPDHGDIYPESVTVTAIPAGDATTITLPNDTLSVAISILAPYAGEGGLTIAYPTASGAKHSNKVFFNMAGLSKLTANLPDTHLEVVSGSDIDLSDVHTSTSTFVIQKGARVGTANIQQGNARIAGAVERLNVVAEATADGAQPGSENAVYIFLEKESAVEKIFLASRTDVVVEQPKDHIDVEATEKKVAVYINSGADNSTAKAQNGGVIYVEANVPCTVTADGTSEAEDGTPVSSTVIIESGAAGSEVVATGGASIDLTANDNCSASAEGVAEEDPDTPSTITVTEVKDEDIVIDANTSEGGKIDTDSETAGAVKYYVALIVGEAKYGTLAEAFAAVDSDEDVVMVLRDLDLNSQLTVSKNIILDLNGYTLTTANTESTARPFILTDKAHFTVYGNKTERTDEQEELLHGSLVIPEENECLGFFDFENVAGTENEHCYLVLNNVYMYGETTGINSGSGGERVGYIRLRKDYQDVTLNDCYADTKGYTGKGPTRIVDNGGAYPHVKIEVNGGTFIQRTAVANRSSFFFYGENANPFTMTGVTIESNQSGGVCMGPGTLSNNSISFSGTTHASNELWNAAVSLSEGDVITINSGTYSAYHGLYMMNSGGGFNVSGGTFVASHYVLYSAQKVGSEGVFNITGGDFTGSFFLQSTRDKVNISGGTFRKGTGYDTIFQYINGDSSDKSCLTITGGTFGEDPTAYVAEGYIATYDSTTELYSVVPDPSNCIVYTPGIEPVLSIQEPNVEYPDIPSNYEVMNFYLQLNRTEEDPESYSFEDAVDNAQAGQVIKLTKDVTVGSLAVPADVSIDFAGYTLTATKLSCKSSEGKFILKQSNHANPYKASFVGELEDAEIRGGSYLFDPTDYTPNGVGVVIPGQGEYAGGYYVPAVPEPKVFYANDDIVQLLGGLTIGKILGGASQFNNMVVYYGDSYQPYNSIEIRNGLYAFQADFNENEYTTNAYEDWYADYVIYYDKDVKLENNNPTVGLWGHYGNMTYAIMIGDNVPANYKCPMLGLVSWGWEYSRIRSDVKTFLCGPTNHSEANDGTTATVELRLYKEKPTMEGINAPGFKDYITVGRYVHPLDEPSLTPGAYVD